MTEIEQLLTGSLTALVEQTEKQTALISLVGWPPAAPGATGRSDAAPGADTVDGDLSGHGSAEGLNRTDQNTTSQVGRAASAARAARRSTPPGSPCSMRSTSLRTTPAGPWRAAAAATPGGRRRPVGRSGSAWVGVFDFGEVPLPPGQTKSERDLIRAYRLLRRMLRTWAQAQARAGAPRVVSPPQGQGRVSGLPATPQRLTAGLCRVTVNAADEPGGSSAPVRS